MGNPSDGFFGKTISLSIKNFWAEVTICESAKLVIMPHPLCDPTEFGSLADLHGISTKEGYLGGLRLLQVCRIDFLKCYILIINVWILLWHLGHMQQILSILFNKRNCIGKEKLLLEIWHEYSKTGKVSIKVYPFHTSCISTLQS